MAKYLLHGLCGLWLLAAPSCRLGYGVDADAEPEVALTFCQQLGHDWGFNYCRDFDDDEPFEFGWDNQVAEPGTTVESDRSAFSPPTSFLAKVPINSGDDACLSAYSEAQGTGDSDSLRLNFQVRMGSTDDQTPFAGSFMTLGAISSEGFQRCSFTIYGDGSSGGVVTSAVLGNVHPFTVRFPLQYAWTKVALDVDFEADTFDLFLDGETAFSNPQPLAADCSFDGNFVVVPGLRCDEDIPISSGEVRLDDIYISYNPVPN